MKINVGTLKDQKEDLASFLEPRVGAKPSVSGDSIEVEDQSIRPGVRPRHVKTYIKRFMHMKGVKKKYRVFVAGRELTIQEIELSEKEEEERKKEAEAKAKAEEKAAAIKEEGKAQGAEEPTAKQVQEEQKQAKKAARKPRAKKTAQENQPGDS